jgi:DNA repair exonuclease SbcCD ATPase subunit
MNTADKETEQAQADPAELAPTDAAPAGEIDTASETPPEAGEGDDDGELVVSIGEEAPPQPPEDTAAPAWVRDLRKQNRELTKRLKQLEGEREQAQQPAQAALPAKPTLESCDWDEAKFADAVVEWNEAKRKADEVQANLRKQEEQAQQKWNERLNAYTERKQSLKVEDADDAENAVRDALVAQWGEHQGNMRWAIIVDGADDPAMLVYALGKYPDKAKELAKIESLAQFTFKAAKLETEMKVTKRKATTAPEKPITGTAAVGVAGADAALERLREQAAKTGDYTEVLRYKRQQRAA